MNNIYIDAKHSYEYLNRLHKYIDDNDLWEYSEQYVFSVKQHIKKIKRLPGINPFGDTGASTWLKALDDFEYMYYKMIYYKELWSSSDWIYDMLYEYDPLTKHSYREINRFIETLLAKPYLVKYKNDISRIVRGTLSGSMLLKIFNTLKQRTTSFTNINEGFYNPFDDDDDYTEPIKSEVIKADEDRIIKSIKIYNNRNKIGSIIYKDGKVYANKTFYKDDIIEVAPVRILHDVDLYSSNVRQITFPIDLSKRIFGVPFGLGSIARNENCTGITGNIDYEYDPADSDNITIYATKNIRKGEELIFVKDNTFECVASINKFRQVLPDMILKVSANE